MGEIRTPVEIWTRRLLESDGKKAGDFRTQKVELFPAFFWAEHWEPGSELFAPRLPLQTRARKEYWLSRYRIRVNGRWVGTRAKYVTFTRDEILGRYFR